MIAQTNFCKKAKLIVLILLFSTNLQYKSAGVDELITGICIEEFRSEMKDASLSIPSGMDRYTCKCFLSLLNKGLSLDSAKSICKEKASKKYSL